MTEPARSRRSFLRFLTGGGETAPPPATSFSLSRFYAKRQAGGEGTTESLPTFERTVSADFETTAVGTPELKRGKR